MQPIPGGKVELVRLKTGSVMFAGRDGMGHIDEETVELLHTDDDDDDNDDDNDDDDDEDEYTVLDSDELLEGNSEDVELDSYELVDDNKDEDDVAASLLDREELIDEVVLGQATDEDDKVRLQTGAGRAPLAVALKYEQTGVMMLSKAVRSSAVQVELLSKHGPRMVPMNPVARQWQATLSYSDPVQPSCLTANC
jgi:hypothetical protein